MDQSWLQAALIGLGIVLLSLILLVVSDELPPLDCTDVRHAIASWINSEEDSSDSAVVAPPAPRTSSHATGPGHNAVISPARQGFNGGTRNEVRLVAARSKELSEPYLAWRYAFPSPLFSVPRGEPLFLPKERRILGAILQGQKILLMMTRS